MKQLWYLYFILALKVSENCALLNINTALAPTTTKDNPVLLKILQTVDAATSDERLFDVTLKLLKSLCVCMRETLRTKQLESRQLSGEMKSLQTEDNVRDANKKVLDLYQNIYNKTCFDLRQELALKVNKSTNLTPEEEKEFMNHSNCGKKAIDENTEDYEMLTRQINRPIKSETKLKNILHTTFVTTRDYHKFHMRKFNLYKKPQKLTQNFAKHSIIVILTYHPVANGSNSVDNFTEIISFELNMTLYSRSPIDIDIIDTRYGNNENSKEDDFIPKPATNCALKSIYTFLLQNEQMNKTKVFKMLRKKGTIKVYIDIPTKINHIDYSKVCCSNETEIPLCKIDFSSESFETQEITTYLPEFKKRKKLRGSFKDTISKIKTLVKLYDKKLNKNKIEQLNVIPVKSKTKSKFPYIINMGNEDDKVFEKQKNELQPGPELSTVKKYIAHVAKQNISVNNTSSNESWMNTVPENTESGETKYMMPFTSHDDQTTSLPTYKDNQETSIINQISLQSHLIRSNVSKAFSSKITFENELEENIDTKAVFKGEERSSKFTNTLKSLKLAVDYQPITAGQSNSAKTQETLKSLKDDILIFDPTELKTKFIQKPFSTILKVETGITTDDSVTENYDTSKNFKPKTTNYLESNEKSNFTLRDHTKKWQNLTKLEINQDYKNAKEPKVLPLNNSELLNKYEVSNAMTSDQHTLAEKFVLIPKVVTENKRLPFRLSNLSDKNFNLSNKSDLKKQTQINTIFSHFVTTANPDTITESDTLKDDDLKRLVSSNQIQQSRVTDMDVLSGTKLESTKVKLHNISSVSEARTITVANYVKEKISSEMTKIPWITGTDHNKITNKFEMTEPYHSSITSAIFDSFGIIGPITASTNKRFKVIKSSTSPMSGVTPFENLQLTNLTNTTNKNEEKSDYLRKKSVRKPIVNKIKTDRKIASEMEDTQLDAVTVTKVYSNNKVTYPEIDDNFRMIKTPNTETESHIKINPFGTSLPAFRNLAETWNDFDIVNVNNKSKVHPTPKTDNFKIPNLEKKDNTSTDDYPLNDVITATVRNNLKIKNWLKISKSSLTKNNDKNIDDLELQHASKTFPILQVDNTAHFFSKIHDDMKESIKITEGYNGTFSLLNMTKKLNIEDGNFAFDSYKMMSKMIINKFDKPSDSTTKSIHLKEQNDHSVNETGGGFNSANDEHFKTTQSLKAISKISDVVENNILKDELFRSTKVIDSSHDTIQNVLSTERSNAPSNKNIDNFKVGKANSLVEIYDQPSYNFSTAKTHSTLIEQNFQDTLMSKVSNPTPTKEGFSFIDVEAPDITNSLSIFDNDTNISVHLTTEKAISRIEHKDTDLLSVTKYYQPIKEMPSEVSPYYEKRDYLGNATKEDTSNMNTVKMTELSNKQTELSTKLSKPTRNSIEITEKLDTRVKVNRQRDISNQFISGIEPYSIKGNKSRSTRSTSAMINLIGNNNKIITTSTIITPNTSRVINVSDSKEQNFDTPKVSQIPKSLEISDFDNPLDITDSPFDITEELTLDKTYMATPEVNTEHTPEYAIKLLTPDLNSNLVYITESINKNLPYLETLPATVNEYSNTENLYNIVKTSRTVKQAYTDLPLDLVVPKPKSIFLEYNTGKQKINLKVNNDLKTDLSEIFKGGKEHRESHSIITSENKLYDVQPEAQYSTDWNDTIVLNVTEPTEMINNVELRPIITNKDLKISFEPKLIETQTSKILKMNPKNTVSYLVESTPIANQTIQSIKINNISNFQRNKAIVQFERIHNEINSEGKNLQENKNTNIQNIINTKTESSFIDQQYTKTAYNRAVVKPRLPSDLTIAKLITNKTVSSERNGQIRGLTKENIKNNNMATSHVLPVDKLSTPTEIIIEFKSQPGITTKSFKNRSKSIIDDTEPLLESFREERFNSYKHVTESTTPSHSSKSFQNIDTSDDDIDKKIISMKEVNSGAFNSPQDKHNDMKNKLDITETLTLVEQSHINITPNLTITTPQVNFRENYTAMKQIKKIIPSDRQFRLITENTTVNNGVIARNFSIHNLGNNNINKLSPREMYIHFDGVENESTNLPDIADSGSRITEELNQSNTVAILTFKENNSVRNKTKFTAPSETPIQIIDSFSPTKYNHIDHENIFKYDKTPNLLKENYTDEPYNLKASKLQRNEMKKSSEVKNTDKLLSSNLVLYVNDSSLKMAEQNSTIYDNAISEDAIVYNLAENEHTSPSTVLQIMDLNELETLKAIHPTEVNLYDVRPGIFDHKLKTSQKPLFYLTKKDKIHRTAPKAAVIAINNIQTSNDVTVASLDKNKIHKPNKEMYITDFKDATETLKALLPTVTNPITESYIFNNNIKITEALNFDATKTVGILEIKHHNSSRNITESATLSQSHDYFQVTVPLSKGKDKYNNNAIFSNVIGTLNIPSQKNTGVVSNLVVIEPSQNSTNHILHTEIQNKNKAASTDRVKQVNDAYKIIKMKESPTTHTNLPLNDAVFDDIAETKIHDVSSNMVNIINSKEDKLLKAMEPTETINNMNIKFANSNDILKIIEEPSLYVTQKYALNKTQSTIPYLAVTAPPPNSRHFYKETKIVNTGSSNQVKLHNNVYKTMYESTLINNILIPNDLLVGSLSHNKIHDVTAKKSDSSNLNQAKLLKTLKPTQVINNINTRLDILDYTRKTIEEPSFYETLNTARNKPELTTRNGNLNYFQEFKSVSTNKYSNNAVISNVKATNFSKPHYVNTDSAHNFQETAQTPIYAKTQNAIKITSSETVAYIKDKFRETKKTSFHKNVTASDMILGNTAENEIRKAISDEVLITDYKESETQQRYAATEVRNKLNSTDKIYIVTKEPIFDETQSEEHSKNSVKLEEHYLFSNLTEITPSTESTKFFKRGNNQDSHNYFKTRNDGKPTKFWNSSTFTSGADKQIKTVNVLNVHEAHDSTLTELPMEYFTRIQNISKTLSNVLSDVKLRNAKENTKTNNITIPHNLKVTSFPESEQEAFEPDIFDIAFKITTKPSFDENQTVSILNILRHKEYNSSQYLTQSTTSTENFKAFDIFKAEDNNNNLKTTIVEGTYNELYTEAVSVVKDEHFKRTLNTLKKSSFSNLNYKDKVSYAVTKPCPNSIKYYTVTQNTTVEVSTDRNVYSNDEIRSTRAENTEINEIVAPSKMIFDSLANNEIYSPSKTLHMTESNKSKILQNVAPSKISHFHTRLHVTDKHYTIAQEPNFTETQIVTNLKSITPADIADLTSSEILTKFTTQKGDNHTDLSSTEKKFVFKKPDPLSLVEEKQRELNIGITSNFSNHEFKDSDFNIVSPQYYVEAKNTHNKVSNITNVHFNDTFRTSKKSIKIPIITIDGLTANELSGNGIHETYEPTLNRSHIAEILSAGEPNSLRDKTELKYLHITDSLNLTNGDIKNNLNNAKTFDALDVLKYYTGIQKSNKTIVTARIDDGNINKIGEFSNNIGPGRLFTVGTITRNENQKSTNHTISASFKKIDMRPSSEIQNGTDNQFITKGDKNKEKQDLRTKNNNNFVTQIISNQSSKPLVRDNFISLESTTKNGLQHTVTSTESTLIEKNIKTNQHIKINADFDINLTETSTIEATTTEVVNELKIIQLLNKIRNSYISNNKLNNIKEPSNYQSQMTQTMYFKESDTKPNFSSTTISKIEGFKNANAAENAVEKYLPTAVYKIQANPITNIDHISQLFGKTDYSSTTVQPNENHYASREIVLKHNDSYIKSITNINNATNAIETNTTEIEDHTYPISLTLSNSEIQKVTKLNSTYKDYNTEGRLPNIEKINELVTEVEPTLITLAISAPTPITFSLVEVSTKGTVNTLEIQSEKTEDFFSKNPMTVRTLSQQNITANLSDEMASKGTEDNLKSYIEKSEVAGHNNVFNTSPMINENTTTLRSLALPLGNKSPSKGATLLLKIPPIEIIVSDLKFELMDTYNVTSKSQSTPELHGKFNISLKAETNNVTHSDINDHFELSDLSNKTKTSDHNVYPTKLIVESSFRSQFGSPKNYSINVHDKATEPTISTNPKSQTERKKSVKNYKLWDHNNIKSNKNIDRRYYIKTPEAKKKSYLVQYNHTVTEIEQQKNNINTSSQIIPNVTSRLQTLSPLPKENSVTHALTNFERTQIVEKTPKFHNTTLMNSTNQNEISTRSADRKVENDNIITIPLQNYNMAPVALEKVAIKQWNKMNQAFQSRKHGYGSENVFPKLNENAIEKTKNTLLDSKTLDNFIVSNDIINSTVEPLINVTNVIPYMKNRNTKNDFLNLTTVKPISRNSTIVVVISINLTNVSTQSLPEWDRKDNIITNQNETTTNKSVLNGTVESLEETSTHKTHALGKTEIKKNSKVGTPRNKVQRPKKLPSARKGNNVVSHSNLSTMQNTVTSSTNNKTDMLMTLNSNLVSPAPQHEGEKDKNKIISKLHMQQDRKPDIVKTGYVNGQSKMGDKVNLSGKKQPSSNAKIEYKTFSSNQHVYITSKSFLTTTKQIKYNTYRPTAEDELDPQEIDKIISSFPRYYEKKIKTKNPQQVKNFHNDPKENDRKYNTKQDIHNNTSLFDPLDKKNVYPIKKVANIPRKLIKRLKLGNRRNEIMTMNTADFFSRRRAVTQKDQSGVILKQYPKPVLKLYPVTTKPRNVILRPVFSSFDTSRKKPSFMKPVVMQKMDTDYYRDLYPPQHRRSGSGIWKNVINKLRDDFAPVPSQTGYGNPVIDTPYYMPTIMKPKFLRDRVNSIRSYIYNAEQNPNYFNNRKHFISELDDTVDTEDPLIQYSRVNSRDEEDTDTSPIHRVTRPRKTIFFLSPTVPYNRYF